ncbi:MAG: 3-phosphoshikimate 1-carboxyvinyltransferase, partial [Actinobacteria bacterium]|nr:3-phosphoshikimate 1-carboxyvinyltransferase [Actinomycetota bacterium]
ATGAPGSRVELGDVGLNPTRTGALDVLRAMGARFDGAPDREWSGEPVGDLRVDAAPLGPGAVEGDLVVRAIDELPVLAVAGALGGGQRVRGAGELRVKESDRIAGVARLLAALGVGVDVRDDGFDVPAGATLRGGAVDSRGDHRIAMSAAVAALIARGPVRVTGFSAVATSYPSFLADLVALGGRWEPG